MNSIFFLLKYRILLSDSSSIDLASLLYSANVQGPRRVYTSWGAKSRTAVSVGIEAAKRLNTTARIAVAKQLGDQGAQPLIIFVF